MYLLNVDVGFWEKTSIWIDPSFGYISACSATKKNYYSFLQVSKALGAPLLMVCFRSTLKVVQL